MLKNDNNLRRGWFTSLGLSVTTTSAGDSSKAMYVEYVV